MNKTLIRNAALALGIALTGQAGAQLADDPLLGLPLDAPVITRGDLVLTVGEIRAQLAGYQAERAVAMRTDPEALRTLLNGMFRKKAIAAEARSMGAQDEELAQWGIKVAEDEFLSRYYLEKRISETETPDYSILAREQYLANKEQMRVPEQVRAAHLLISTESRSEDEARALIEDIYAQMQAGEDFGVLANRHSEDSGSGAEGDLGWFPRGAMVPEFDQAAFALENIGDVSGIVQTNFGFHIIRLDDRRASYIPEFEELEDNLIANLRKNHLDDARREIITSFDQREGVELNEDALRALRIVPNFADNDG